MMSEVELQQTVVHIQVSDLLHEAIVHDEHARCLWVLKGRLLMLFSPSQN
jgi:hypothetical protein